MKRSIFSKRRRFLATVAASMAAMSTTKFAFAADPLKIGLILPLTGPFASTGKQIEAACRLYIARNGDTVAGRKVELIVRDDTGLAPETTKRIAQELILVEGNCGREARGQSGGRHGIHAAGRPHHEIGDQEKRQAGA